MRQLAGTDALLQAIQGSDERELRQARKAYPFYLLAALIYAPGCAVSIVGANSGVPSRAIRLGVLASALMVVGSLLIRKLRAMRALDYTKPVRSFLEETEDRYRFMRPADMWYSIPLLLVLAVTGGFSVVDSLIPRYFTKLQLKPIVAAYGFFFAAVCGLGYHFSHKNWRSLRGVLEPAHSLREYGHPSKTPRTLGVQYLAAARPVTTGIELKQGASGCGGVLSFSGKNPFPI